jgi:hypothetical protein
MYPRRDLHDHQVQIQGRRFIEVGSILPPCLGLFWSLLGFLLLFPGPSMAVGARVGSRLLNAVLSLAMTSSSTYLLILFGVFSVVKRSMLK